MAIYESGENYLEAILMLKNKTGGVRSIDVANHLNFSKPSVSRAMGILRNSGYILIDAQGQITLTDLGLEKASSVYERHTLLSDCLIRLGVSEQTAREDACRIEHVISDETFERIKVHMKSKEAV